ncbi:MAG: LEA type 2 family protein [bacterium]|nr:LEA type 2 family protein [bacterium]
MSFSKTLVSLRWVVVLCLAALALSGYWALPVSKAFAFVSVSDIKTTDGLEVEISLQIENPYDVGCDIRSVTGDLSLNGVVIAHATADNFRLKPRESTVVPVKIRSSTDDTSYTLALISALILQGEPVNYELKGELRVKKPKVKKHRWSVNIPISKKVHFSCTGSLRLSMQGKTIHYDLENTLKVKKPSWWPGEWWPGKISFPNTGEKTITELMGSSIKLSGGKFQPNQYEVSISDIQIKTTNGLEVDVSLLIKNPSGVGCDIQSLTGDLSLNNLAVAQATVNSFRLEPHNSVVVPVKITMDMPKALALISRLILENKPANYELKGALRVKDLSWQLVKAPFPEDVAFSSTGSLRLGIQDKTIHHYDLKNTLTVNVKPVVSAHAIPEWFEPNVYLTNKLHQLGDGQTRDSMIQELNKAGYFGDEGYYRHFLDWGNHENVSPNKCFDVEYYFESKLAQLQRVDPAGHWTLESIKKSFEKEGLSAWDHYTHYGMEEGIDPCKDFSTTKYLEAKLTSLQSADPSWTKERMIRAFQAANLNPVAHYYAYGVHENLAYRPNCSKSK